MLAESLEIIALEGNLKDSILSQLMSKYYLTNVLPTVFFNTNRGHFIHSYFNQ